MVYNLWQKFDAEVSIGLKDHFPCLMDHWLKFYGFKFKDDFQNFIDFCLLHGYFLKVYWLFYKSMDHCSHIMEHSMKFFNFKYMNCPKGRQFCMDPNNCFMIYF